MTLVQSRPRASARRTRTRTRTSASVGRLVAICLLVLGCWAAVLVVARPTTADAVLRSTSPGNGQAARPERLLLTFDRPVPAGFVTVRLTDPYRRAVALDRPRRVDGRADTISVPMPATRFAGTYTVAWRMPSSRLEPVGGTFTFDFVSRSRAHPAPRIETNRSTALVVVSTVARFAAYVALAALAGAVFLVAVSGRGRRLRRLIRYAWLGLVAATLTVLVSFGPYAAWAPLTGVLDPALLVATLQSETGAAMLARLLVLVLAGLGAAELVAARPASTKRERWLRGSAVVACTAAFAATWALPGHGTSGSLVPLDMAVDVGWLTATAVGTGGLLVWSAARLRGRRRVAGKDRQRVAPPKGHRRLVLVGTAVAGTILAGTAVLTAVRPGLVAPAAQKPAGTLPAPARLAFDTGGPGGKGWLDLVVAPAAVGPNTLHFSVLDPKGAPKEGSAIRAVLERAGRRTTSIPARGREVAPGHLVGTVTIPAGGEWTLAVTITSAGGHQQTLTGVVDVG